MHAWQAAGGEMEKAPPEPAKKSEPMRSAESTKKN
jgi:hypothetical protein